MDIDELTAREAIRELIARYALAGDRGRLDALAACFAPDGVLQFPGTTARGPAAIASALASAPPVPGLTLVRHHVTTQAIDLSPDRGVADARSYFLVLSDAGPDHGGVYVDRLRRQGSAWLFSHRQVRIDWQSSGSLFPRFPTRRRDA
jgi:hypothetical protein